MLLKSPIFLWPSRSIFTHNFGTLNFPSWIIITQMCNTSLILFVWQSQNRANQCNALEKAIYLDLRFFFSSLRYRAICYTTFDGDGDGSCEMWKCVCVWVRNGKRNCLCLAINHTRKKYANVLFIIELDALNQNNGQNACALALALGNGILREARKIMRIRAIKCGSEKK